VLASASLREERIEGVVTAADRFVTGHLTIWLNAMLEAKQLPARIADLNASLADVDTNSFAHFCVRTRSEAFS
jgi:hypothetical protein